MEIEVQFIVRASVLESWDFLLDPVKISSCIPGCERLEVIDANNYRSIIKVKVGPIPARFKIKSTINEIKRPYSLVSVSKGVDTGKAGFLSMKTMLNLRELSEDRTEITGKSEVNLIGRLSTFGDRIIRAKAKQLIEEFKEQLCVKLEKGGG
ncbi:MAG: SRPBCC domain-containing protein [Thermodesulfobacteriota bacterium]|nr:SRPBCC domain-containing protein [Thermodesulfobacteriota bacterium]